MTRSTTRSTAHSIPRRGGSALIAVLWTLVLLSVAAFSVLHATQLELRVVKNHGDLEQARFLALAGIEKAKAMIYLERKNARQRAKDDAEALRDNPQAFRDIVLGRGKFRVIHQTAQQRGSADFLFGVRDEESLLNANTASIEELRKLPGASEEVAAAIVDWRDEDRKVTPSGAEEDLYVSMQPPRRIRNGPIESLREMLMIHGVAPDLLLGEDLNANGLLDLEEDDGARSAPPDNQNGSLDAGWSQYLTIESGVPDENVRGKARINIQTAPEETLTTLDGVSTDIAKAIVAHRGRSEFGSIADLLDVTAPPPPQPQAAAQAQPAPPGPAPGAPQAPRSSRSSSRRSRKGAEPPPSPESPSPQAAVEASGQPSGTPAAAGPAAGDQSGGGAKLISTSLLKKIADDVTVSHETELKGVININSASRDVLFCVPGIGEDLADAIVQRRQGNPFASVAELLDVPGMTVETFKKTSGRFTTRSATYRIVSEGLLEATGARYRIEAVIRLGSLSVETLYHREGL